MKTFDADSSGSINYEEFRKQLRRCTCHVKYKLSGVRSRSTKIRYVKCQEL